MSLRGLDAPEIIEAFQATTSEPGGWLLIKYISRDEVSLLARGNGSVVDLRASIASHTDDSPLYGFLRFRRRGVLLRYVAQDASRLIQARVTVHFRTVADRFSPYDAVFTITEPGELKETALSAACSLHAASGSTASSNSSIHRKRLGEIVEDDDESPTSPSEIEKPLPPLPHELARRRERVESIETRPDPRSEPELRPPSSYDPPDLERSHSTATVPSQDWSARPDDHPPRAKSASSSSSSSSSSHSRPDSALRWGAHTRASVGTDGGILYRTRTKVRLGPRPSLDVRRRSQTAGAFPHSNDRRPVASLPAGIRMSPPRSQTSPSSPYTNAVSALPPFPRSVSISSAPPPDPVPPSSRSTVRFRPGTSPDPVAIDRPSTPSSVARALTRTPEKQKLMKALELRKRQLEDSARQEAQEAQEAPQPAEQAQQEQRARDAQPAQEAWRAHQEPSKPHRSEPIDARATDEPPDTSNHVEPTVDDDDDVVEHDPSRLYARTVADSALEQVQDEPATSGNGTVHDVTDGDDPIITPVESAEASEHGDADAVVAACERRSHHLDPSPVTDRPRPDGDEDAPEDVGSTEAEAGSIVESDSTGTNNHGGSPWSSEKSLLGFNSTPASSVSDDKPSHLTSSGEEPLTVVHVGLGRERIESTEVDDRPSPIASTRTDATETTMVDRPNPSSVQDGPMVDRSHRTVEASEAQESPSGSLAPEPEESPVEPPIIVETDQTLVPNGVPVHGNDARDRSTTTVVASMNASSSEDDRHRPSSSDSMRSSIEDGSMTSASAIIGRHASRPKRRVVTPSIVTDLGLENSDDNLLSDDSLMDELNSATVQEAKPVSLGRSPRAKGFPMGVPDGRSGPTSVAHRPVSSSTSNVVGSSSDGPRHSNSTVPDREKWLAHADSISLGDPREKQGPITIIKKVNVSSGISQRIKALERVSSQSSSRPSSPPPHATAAAVSVVSSLTTLRKGNLRSASGPPVLSSTFNGANHRPSEGRAQTPIKLDPRPGDRIDPPLDQTEAVPHRSQMIQEMKRLHGQKIQTSRRPKVVTFSDDVQISPAAEGDDDDDEDESVLSPRAEDPDDESDAGPETSELGKSPTGTSPIEAFTVEAASTESWQPSSMVSSTAMGRISIDGPQTIASQGEERSDDATSVTVIVGKDDSTETRAVPSASEQSPGHESSSSKRNSVDVGDVNVQFPDNMLWKRRFMKLDSEGNVILMASKTDENAKVNVRRYHISKFTLPCAPDLDMQEMPNSVVMGFQDGSTSLQCACESPVTQTHVLHVLRESHQWWNP